MTSLLFFASILSAMPLDQGAFDADSVVYHDNEISLSGNVQIENRLGTLHADSATTEISQDKKISKIKLNGNTSLKMNRGEMLACQRAEIDCNSFSAIFNGSEDIPDVVFENSSSENEAPLRISSLEMKLVLVNGQGAKPELNTIIADRDVRVEYNKDYHVQSDHAEYCHLPEGRLVLSSDPSDDSFCIMKHLIEDTIKSKQIVVNTEKRQLAFDHSQGVLQDQVEFSCDRLTWDDKARSLLLEKGVKIKQIGLGDLVTDYSVKIAIKDGESQEIRTIESEQDTTLSYADSNKGLMHKVTSYGPMKMDQEKLQITMESPLEAYEKGKQVSFSDLTGDISADRAILTYTQQEGSFTPVHLHMEGHVHCINRYDGHLKESGMVLQYAMADTIDYYPEKQELILKGKNKERVLLFDKVKNMQMSAPSLTITNLDPAKKPKVQGSGDVRFKFADRELEQMRHYFHFEDPT